MTLTLARRLFLAAAASAFRSAARAMIRSNIAPVSPDCAGRFEIQISGVSTARMSSKSPSLFTLLGANSVMSRSPDHSSRCLMSSHWLASPVRGLVRTNVHEPCSLEPRKVNDSLPASNPSSMRRLASALLPQLSPPSSGEYTP